MDVHDLTAAYALDALDGDERDGYEAHLAQCERCRGELATLGEATTALALAVPAPAPPARLRSRILDAAAAERANVVPLPMRRVWLTRATAAAASVAACAAIGLGVWGATLSHDLADQKALNAQTERATQILLDPTSQKTNLRGGRGMVAVDATGRGVLIVDRLPAAPSGKTYEAWVIPPGGEPKRAGLFKGGGTMTMVPLDANVPPGAVVAATVERSGGASRPTTTPILSAQT
jgi:anti-sigma-K factor RskA